MSKNGNKICLKIYLTTCLKRSLKIVSWTWPLIFKLKISKQHLLHIKVCKKENVSKILSGLLQQHFECCKICEKKYKLQVSYCVHAY